MTVGPNPCACGIPDWRDLRVALGLYQTEMAALLNVIPKTVWKAEQSPHVCPTHRFVMNLRRTLTDPRLLAILRENGYKYPYASDITQPFFWASEIKQRCHVCHIPLIIHAKCLFCTGLGGKNHLIGELDSTGVCAACRHNVIVTVRTERERVAMVQSRR